MVLSLTERHTGQMDIKNETSIYAVYTRPSSDLGTQTDWKWRDGKRYSMQVEIKKAGISILISDKIDYEKNAVIRVKERHINYKYLYTT